MIEVDVYWFFWMSMATYPLHSFPSGGVPLSGISAYLGIARVALENFGDERGRVFPKTGSAIKSILDWINAIMPERTALLTRDKMITPSEIATLNNHLAALVAFLRDEAQHNYVLCVENQRFLSAHSLVEKIDTCFSEEAWNTIEKSAKREFDEAGKCLATERYTGAGFHALRGVECVIRQYIVKLTGALPKKRDWGHYIEVLKANGADPALTSVLDNIRSLERNPLMHPEDWLNVDEAIGIFTIAQTAIVRLVAGIKK
jgi:hypothetical protein